MNYHSFYRCAMSWGLFLARASCSGPADPETRDDVQITGTGLVRTAPVTFSTTVDVERRSGYHSGSVSAWFADGDSVTFQGRSQCLRTVGNSAWIGINVTATSNAQRAPPGAPAIVEIQDLGGPGEDRMHGELMPFSIYYCIPFTALYPTVVAEGDYQFAWPGR